MNWNPIIMYTALVQNPKTRWITIILTVVYIVSPIDLIPDFLLPFGIIDDGLVVTFFIIALKELGKNRLKK
jgi:uncharacterized membrane protein YkvA (DUF1232 family)